MLSYRIDEAAPGEVQADPFGGHGLFLAMDAPAAEILAALEVAAGGVVPAVAFEGAGVWVDARGGGIDRGIIIAGWGKYMIREVTSSRRAARDDRG